MKSSKRFDQRPIHPIFLRNSRLRSPRSNEHHGKPSHCKLGLFVQGGSINLDSGLGDQVLISDLNTSCKEHNADKGVKTPKASISLSEFLDRKLSKAVPQKSMKGKRVNFPSLDDGMGSITGEKQENPQGGGLVDVCIFRCSGAVSGNVDGDPKKPSSIQSVSTQIGEDGHGSRERKRSRLEGEEKKFTSTSSLVILGDDPKPKQTRTLEFMNKRRPENLFNHYANGSGWWDYGMEGVDSEEVGIQEAWEGMGSASLGGLQWQDIDL